MKKLYKYLFLVILCNVMFFQFKTDVFAAVYFNGEPYSVLYNSENNTFSYGDGRNWVKYIIKSKAEEYCNPKYLGNYEYGNYKRCWAFCASNGLQFNTNVSNNPSNYQEITNYSTDKCKYNNKDVFCSRFVGELIAAGYSYTSSNFYGDIGCTGCTSAAVKYFPEQPSQLNAIMRYQVIQFAVWDFIARNLEAPSGYATVFKAYWGNNATAKTRYNFPVLNTMYDTASTNYFKDNSSEQQVNLSQYIITSVAKSSFVYKPSCEKDEYVTGKITIANSYNKSLDFTITVPDDVYICDNNDNCSKKNKTFNILGNKKQNVTIYLKKVNPESATSFDASIVATYPSNGTEVVDTTGKCNNSTYFHTTTTSFQDMIVPGVTNCTSTQNLVSDGKAKKVGVTLQKVEHKTCEKSFGSNYKNLSDSEKTGVCANDVTDNDSSQYVADFSDCDECYVVELSDGKKVNILIKEQVKFQFGNLIPGVLHVGGGLSFVKPNDNGTVNGITTEYASAISWDYRDFVNGKAYYYDSVTQKGYTVDSGSGTLSSSDMEELITNFLYDKIKSDDFKLNFFTISESEVYDVNLVGQNFGGIAVRYIYPELKIEKSGKKIYISSGALALNKACFNTKGEVRYYLSDSCGEDYPIDGGYAHYVPLDYTYDNYIINAKKNGATAFNFLNDKSNSFPFILGMDGDNKQNLSITSKIKSSINFWYNATCAVKINDVTTDCPPNTPKCPNYSLAGITYRPIDISDPFPSATGYTDAKNIPSNWYDWWQNASNRNRVNNTFRSLEKAVYKINFNETSGFKWNTSFNYGDWDEVNAETGTSKFVLNNDMITSFGNGSYCPIGTFSKTCDKYSN